jgi:hypothetical protein
MKCCSGKHDWLDPVSAERCCRPGWTRVQRFGVGDYEPGDAEDGVVIIGAGGWRYVWHYAEVAHEA